MSKEIGDETKETKTTFFFPFMEERMKHKIDELKGSLIKYEKWKSEQNQHVLKYKGGTGFN